MSPNSISRRSLRDAPTVRTDDTIEHGVRELVDSGLPALPVLDDRGHFAGIFGEREFMGALFPGYLHELRSSAFITHSLDETLERRETCRRELIERHMNTEHVDVAPDFADVQLAEIFLHHRVLIVPVVDRGKVAGVITRADFFREVAQRFLDGA